MGENATVVNATDIGADDAGSLDLWMSRLPEEVRSRPLCQLAIPGSHNSLSYTLRMADCPPEPAPDLVSPLTELCRCAPRLARPLLARWAVTQQLDVYQQLAGGVRYLDVRASWRAGTLHVVHGLHGPPLAPLLAEVRRFVEGHPAELVILDLQHVYGLDEASFGELSGLLRATFGEALVPRDQTAPTLAACAAAGHRVLALFRGDPDFSGEHHPHLWDRTALWSPWPDTQSAHRLFPLLERHIARAARQTASRLHVHQCVYTPRAQHMVLRAASSLRRLAAGCNAETSSWLRGQSVRRGLNIVMTDFVGVGEHDLVKQIIQKNYEL